MWPLNYFFLILYNHVKYLFDLSKMYNLSKIMNSGIYFMFSLLYSVNVTEFNTNIMFWSLQYKRIFMNLNNPSVHV